MQPEERIKSIIEVGGVISDSVRLAVMLYLSVRGKARFKEVSEGLGLSTGRLAHHFKTLENAGYVKVDRPWEDLRARIISLTPEGVYALRGFLSKLREAQGNPDQP